MQKAKSGNLDLTSLQERMPISSMIESLLLKAITVDRTFPPAIVYNESWLLRLVLDWISRRDELYHPLGFSKGARWFSEAWLPSRFLSRNRRDWRGEGHTHADGVIGHVVIGKRSVADITLAVDARQFAVVEAKLSSRLSPGVKNAKGFDQAARSIACMAETARLGQRNPCELDKLDFLVVAPDAQIKRHVFTQMLDMESIKEKVRRRNSEFDQGEEIDWFDEWFIPTWRKLKVHCLSWESVIEFIMGQDPSLGHDLGRFYADCLKFNRL